jgi:hypothetical protein
MRSELSHFHVTHGGEGRAVCESFDQIIILPYWYWLTKGTGIVVLPHRQDFFRNIEREDILTITDGTTTWRTDLYENTIIKTSGGKTPKRTQSLCK